MTDGARPSLDSEKNPNQAWRNLMLDGIVAEQDGVIAVRDFAAMVVAVTIEREVAVGRMKAGKWQRSHGCDCRGCCCGWWLCGGWS